MDWYNGWSWIWMGLMMILFWGGLIVLVALLLRVGRLGGRKDLTDTPHRDRIRPRSSGRASPEERSPRTSTGRA